MSLHYSVILGFMGQLRDRFAVYHQPRTLEERLALVAQINGVSGVEMVYPAELSDVAQVRDLLRQYGLRLSAVNVNLKGDPRWHHGALTARDRATRQEAVQWIQRGMDIAAELDSNLVTVSFLADGHDYPFEVDYGRAWRDFVEGVRAAADYRPDVRLSLEYKKSEPRARVILSNVGKGLYTCAVVDRANVGITLDAGHALYAGESFAESVALLADAGRLFLAHGNDNYRDWDWDLIPGSVNLWDLVESTYYLHRVGYDGWVAFDVFPARRDAVATMQASREMYRHAEAIIDRIGLGELTRMIESADGVDNPPVFQTILSKMVQGE